MVNTKNELIQICGPLNFEPSVVKHQAETPQWRGRFIAPREGPLELVDFPAHV